MRKNLLSLRKNRQKRIRARIHGTSDRPRLSVFRSNRGLTVQIVNDDLNSTVLSAAVVAKAKDGKTKVDQAYELGLDLAKKALGQGLSQVVFDRGGYLYHGRVKAVARGAREGGLVF